MTDATAAASPLRRHKNGDTSLRNLPPATQRSYLRNMIERCINKRKNARRLAIRYDKAADSYLGFIPIVSIRLWLRQLVNASETQQLAALEPATHPPMPKEGITLTCASTEFCLGWPVYWYGFQTPDDRASVW